MGAVLFICRISLIENGNAPFIYKEFTLSEILQSLLSFRMTASEGFRMTIISNSLIATRSPKGEDKGSDFFGSISQIGLLHILVFSKVGAFSFEGNGSIFKNVSPGGYAQCPFGILLD